MHHENGIWVSADDLNREENFLQSAQQEFTVETAVEGDGQWEATRRDFLKVLGFGIGTATLAACETPVKKAIPYVSKPDDIVPGVANYFASTIVEGGDYCAVLVKTREGRPIKIEGNSLSSVTGGGTSARAQAAVLSLYDTKRIKGSGSIANGTWTEKAWDALDNELKGKLAAGTTRIVTNSILSPTTKAILDEFAVKYPNTKVVTYDPVSASALLDANLATFGQRVVPHYDFAKATVIASFGADFLGTWISPIEFARAYAKNRKVTKAKGKKMSRHYQIESFMSMTGASADNRIPVKPSEQGVAIAYLYNKLTGGANAPTNGLNDKAMKSLDKVAADLAAARGTGLVVSNSNVLAEQIMINKINDSIGALNNTVRFDAPSYQRQGDDKALAALVGEMNSGGVNNIIVMGANPAYDAPNNTAFAAAFAKVGTRISLNTTMDETTALCNYSAPNHHSLESWGDAEPRKGHFSLIQPTIAPIFKTRQAEESLLVWANSSFLENAEASNGNRYYGVLKANWQQSMTYTAFKPFWDMSLHNGVVEVAPAAQSVIYNPAVTPDFGQMTKPSNSEVELAIYETVNIGNGQYANNPWLQEMPDPVTRTVWGNYLSVPNIWDGVNNINSWKDLKDGEIVKVDFNGQSYECIVVRSFGLAPNTLAIALGQGRTSGGCGVGYGVNINTALKQAGGYTQYAATDVKVEPTGNVDKHFACVQHHHTMGVTGKDSTDGDKIINVDERALGWKGFQGSLTNRSIIFPGTMADIEKLETELTEFHHEAEHLNSQTLYPKLDDWYSMGVKWEMFIDLNSCVGCGACQVACIAENNVPVVGKKEVKRGHEMTWLRIDRYFYGDFENPKVVYQPMMCQHCDNAPCENVCPVAATPHSMEGLNQMAYNRCIGTRYCANNCPYKVRRFNWLDYTTADVWGGNEERVFHIEGDDKPFYADNLVRMVMNPDVTVRSRGVIEKCSFCVQRIQEGKLTAKRENREVADNDVRSACQTACPTDAIVFGNVNNKSSEINKRMKASGPLAYQVLEEINVRPGVHYTAKVHNSNAALDA
jgi:MoCo/4Fe-4S cofactor protein with predicted Tat translocation signal